MMTQTEHETDEPVSQHTLFVEASNSDALDPRLFRDIIDEPSVRVEALGPSSHIRAAAAALHAFHPNYYFLVDRDHHDDEVVDETWETFPDPDSDNLLVWRRREFENYFLNPEFLQTSRFVRNDADVRGAIRKYASDRLHLDAVRQTIIEVRESLKESWVELPTDPAKYTSKDEALRRLQTLDAFDQKAEEFTRFVEEDALEERFRDVLDRMLGETNDLEFGEGDWLDLLKGSAVLNRVVNECFQVDEAEGFEERKQEVLRDLVETNRRTELEPTDFAELRELLGRQVS